MLHSHDMQIFAFFLNPQIPEFVTLEVNVCYKLLFQQLPLNPCQYQSETWPQGSVNYDLHLQLVFDLTHLAREYFEKMAFKKNKKRNFKQLYLKSQHEFRLKTNIFRKFIQFSFKQNGFLYAPHDKGLHPYNPQCRCQWLAGVKELVFKTTSQSQAFLRFSLNKLEAKYVHI